MDNLQETGAFLAPLYSKIAVISGKIGAIQKDANHPQNYKYHSADAILGALNHLMSEHGLVIIPTARGVGVEDGRYIITYRYLICDAETGASVPAEWTGEAPLGITRKDGTISLDDKAMGKAHTYAYKYWLMKLFMISTIDTDDLDGNDSQTKQAPKQKQSAPTDKLEPEAHGLTKSKLDMRLLKEITKPLYDNAKHQDNSINKMLSDGYLKNDMSADTAAAYVFKHRASGKELGFNDNDIKAALGMTLGEFLKQYPRDYATAWKALHEYAKGDNVTGDVQIPF